MTKRSLKGTAISTRAGLTRDANASIWLADTTPDSSKDNPLNLTVLQDVVAANIKGLVDGGLVQLSDSTNDCVAFAPSSVIDVSGSVYEVLSVFYIYCSGNVFKVNTGTATLTDTIRLIVSSTEDGLFQTADIDDGATVVSFGGTTAGNGIINYSDIRWLGSSISADIENGELDLGLNVIPTANNTYDLGSSGSQFKDLYIDGAAYIDQFGEGFIPDTDNSYGIGSALNAWADIHAHDGNFDELYDKAGTGAPDFPQGLTLGTSGVFTSSVVSSAAANPTYHALFPAEDGWYQLYINATGIAVGVTNNGYYTCKLLISNSGASINSFDLHNNNVSIRISGGNVEFTHFLGTIDFKYGYIRLTND